MSLFRNKEKAPIIEKDRPGSFFVELTEDKRETATKLLEDSRRGALHAKAAHVLVEREVDPDLKYRAPESIPSDVSQADFEVLLASALIQEGRVNFTDASITASNELMGGKMFAEEDAQRFSDAAQTITLKLGLEEQQIPVNA